MECVTFTAVNLNSTECHSCSVKTFLLTLPDFNDFFNVIMSDKVCLLVDNFC